MCDVRLSLSLAQAIRVARGEKEREAQASRRKGKEKEVVKRDLRQRRLRFFLPLIFLVFFSHPFSFSLFLSLTPPTPGHANLKANSTLFFCCFC